MSFRSGLAGYSMHCHTIAFNASMVAQECRGMLKRNVSGVTLISGPDGKVYRLGGTGPGFWGDVLKNAGGYAGICRSKRDSEEFLICETSSSPFFDALLQAERWANNGLPEVAFVW